MGGWLVRRVSRGRFPASALVVACGLVLLGAAPALAAEPTYSGSPIFQGPGACPSYGDQQICSGEVASFDGTLLDTDLTLPARSTGPRHPLIVMLNGFGGTKHEWESTTNEGDGGDKYHWNTHWFSQHGYYVLTYTPRGFSDPGPDSSYQPSTPGGSSGQPESGPTSHDPSEEPRHRDQGHAVASGPRRRLIPGRRPIGGRRHRWFLRRRRELAAGQPGRVDLPA